MLLEGLLAYLRFVKEIVIENNIFLKTSLPAWGVPALIVSIVICIDYGIDNDVLLDYGIENELLIGLRPHGYCWLDQKVFFVVFLAPVAIIIIINAVLYGILTRFLLSKISKGNLIQSTQSDHARTVTKIRASVLFFVMLGITWVFGFLALRGVDVAFQYVFCILNSTQGFLIFLLRVYNDKDIWVYWRQLFCKEKSGKVVKEKTSTSTSRTTKTTNLSHITARQESRITSENKSCDLTSKNNKHKNTQNTTELNNCKKGPSNNTNMKHTDNDYSYSDENVIRNTNVNKKVDDVSVDVEKSERAFFEKHAYAFNDETDNETSIDQKVSSYNEATKDKKANKDSITSTNSACTYVEHLSKQFTGDIDQVRSTIEDDEHKNNVSSNAIKNIKDMGSPDRSIPKQNYDKNVQEIKDTTKDTLSNESEISTLTPIGVKNKYVSHKNTALASDIIEQSEKVVIELKSLPGNIKADNYSEDLAIKEHHIITEEEIGAEVNKEVKENAMSVMRELKSKNKH